MLSIALDIAMFASFVVLLVLVWHVSKRPRWRIRAIIYGWGLSIILAEVWALLLPILFRRVMDSRTLAATFPDGAFVMAMLAFGWMWPTVIVGISSYLECRKRRADQTGTVRT
jgi:ABC-type transport system involved in multi-copper enzyme maturation permease subunit